MPLITNIKITIPKDKVLARLGYSQKTGLDKKINQIIDDEISHAQALIEPRAVYREFNIKTTNSSVELIGGFKIESKTLAARLKKADKAVLAAVSISSDLAKKTKDILIDTIRDSIGSEAVEELMSQLNMIISQKAKSLGYKTFARYSVGYGDWDIKGQKKILKTLKADFIKLTKGNIMVPQKSITAIIGWFKE